MSYRSGRPVSGGERVRQPGQPSAQQRVDLLRAELVADLLQGGGVVNGGEAVVQCLERRSGPGGLPLGPVVAVDAQLGVVGEVGAELEEERPEVPVRAVHVEVVDQPGGLHDPRVGAAVAVAALLGPEQRGLLLRPADEQHPLGPPGRLERGQVLMQDVVFALSFREVDPRDALIAGEPADRGSEPVGDLRQRRGGGDRQAELPVHVTHQPAGVLQLRDIDIQVHPVDALDLEHHVLG